MLTRTELRELQADADKALRDALTHSDDQDRALNVRCVIANYGPLLGLELKDTMRVVLDWERQRKRTA